MKGLRPARAGRSKVSWKDINDNSHDLDFVIERNGTPCSIGRPIAFIEIAWRRYTKHSRNKAQEIQGAILPLAEKYKWDCPFIGVIVGGIFTEGSLNQLKSNNFDVLYFDYDTILAAFKAIGIDASFDEDTPDNIMVKKVASYKRLSARKIAKIEDYLRENKKKDIEDFIQRLSKVIEKEVQSITISSFHGRACDLQKLEDAVEYIQNYYFAPETLNIIKFEITIKYYNGDKIEGSFGEKEKAVQFLKD